MAPKKGEKLLINSSNLTPVISLHELKNCNLIRKFFGHRQERLTTKCYFGGYKEKFIVCGSDTKEIFIWNLNNSCYSFEQLALSLCVGGIIGISWAYIIATSNTPALTYFSSLSNKDVCSKPSKNTFRCNVYKNGQLISKNIGG